MSTSGHRSLTAMILDNLGRKNNDKKWIVPHLSHGNIKIHHVQVGKQNRLRTYSYECSNRAGPVGETNFVFCSYRKFNPVRDQCPVRKLDVQKAPKITVEPHSDLPATLQANYAVENGSSQTVPVCGLKC